MSYITQNFEGLEGDNFQPLASQARFPSEGMGSEEGNGYTEKPMSFIEALALLTLLFHILKFLLEERRRKLPPPDKSDET